MKYSLIVKRTPKQKEKEKTEDEVTQAQTHTQKLQKSQTRL